MSTFIQRLVEINVDRNIGDVLVMKCGAYVDLSKVDDGVKSQTLTNLKRGYASALSGKSFALYQVLASAFDFPVYSVGRAENCVISLNDDLNIAKDKLVRDMKAMYALCNPDKSGYKTGDWWWRGHEVEGHRPGWIQLTLPRPQQLNMQALCHMLNVHSTFDLVPKQHTMQAAVALEQGTNIDISPYLRRSS